MTARDCDACRTCHGCGHGFCMHEHPSPGEPDKCAACWDIDDPEAAA